MIKGIGIDKDVLDKFDYELAIKRIKRDINSDFIFAPHYSIIFEKASKELFEQLKTKLLSGNYSTRLPISMNVIKQNGFSRNGSILEPIDRLAYQLVVDYIGKNAENEIDRTQVFSNVLLNEDIDGKMFERSGDSYDKFKNRIQELSKSGKYTHVLKSDISSYLILDFNRTFSIESAFEILEEAASYQHRIIGVGLDSIEDGYPPELFTDVFKRAEELGFHKVCHTGEETPKHITDTLNFLNVERIDHGVQCEHDEKLMQRLVDEQIPLTICPLSNVKLKVFDKMENHNLKRLMDRGIPITINSDDPAYFGGYINENYYKVQQAFNMESWMIVDLAKNSFKFSFLPEKEKKNHIKNIDKFIKGL
jgi:adenosine deaminase